jgi:protocatechuate 3,4-dioxygenase beta subunit
VNILLMVLVALAARVGLPAQEPGASIEGIVVKLGSGEPIANAGVRLTVQDAPRAGAPPTAKSDSNGRFFFANVAPGTYRLFASYDGGFVPAEYGQRTPTGEGTALAIAVGQKITGVQLAMAPTGTIAGHVYDKNGEPLGNAQVMAMRQVYKDGRRTLTIVQMVSTDDRGEYRLFWLAPGNYYVAAKPDISQLVMNIGQPNSYNAPAVHITPPMRFGTYEQATDPSLKTRRLKSGEIVEEMYLPVYYPGTTDGQAAAAIAVPAGATVGGVDVTPEIGLVRPHHIRGRIIDATTGQPARASITAVPRSNDPSFTMPAGSSDAQGSFDLAGVAPGSYQLFVTRYGEGLVGLNGVVNVEIADKNIENFSIVIGPDFKLSGRFVMEDGSRSYPRIGGFTRDPQSVGMMPGNMGPLPPPAADGSFTLDHVAPGDFRVTVQQLPAGGYVKSMRLGNADVLNEGLHLSGPPQGLLEIVIGTNAGNIEGSVLNDRQQVAANGTVVLVPDPRLRQRSDLYKVVSTDNSGRFRITGVAPGDYKLFAWDNVELGAWQDPAFIGAYENAGRPIHIYEGTSENLQLTVIL